MAFGRNTVENLPKKQKKRLTEVVKNGHITGDTVQVVRRDGQIVDYVLPGETCETVGDCDCRASGGSFEGVEISIVTLSQFLSQKFEKE